MSELKPCPPSIENAITVLEHEKQCVLRQSQIGGCDRNCAKCDLVMQDSAILAGYDTAIAVIRRAQPVACEIAEYAEDCKDCGFCAQSANEPLTCEGCEYQKREGWNYENCIRCRRHWPDRYAHKLGGPL